MACFSLNGFIKVVLWNHLTDGKLPTSMRREPKSLQSNLASPSWSGENSQVAGRTTLSLAMNSFLFFLFQLIVRFSSVKTLHLVGYVSALSIPTRSSKGTPLRYTMNRDGSDTTAPCQGEPWTRQWMAKANFKASGFQASRNLLSDSVRSSLTRRRETKQQQQQNGHVLRNSF